jgi:thiol-disulfide isomerase/thioredoxin
MNVPQTFRLISGLLTMSLANLAQAYSPPNDIVVGPELQNYKIEEIEAAYQDRPMPEGVKMYLSIQKGGRMGDGEGWFGPAATRYDWAWLSRRHSLEADQPLTKDTFHGPAEWFDRLDRTLDGVVTADELDWSSRNPWVQQAYMINRLFRKMDPTGDGQLTRDEWLAFYDRIAGEKPAITSDDLRDAWLAGIGGGFLPGDAPNRETLLKGLFAGEIGSLHEGPSLNEPAPDFELSTYDGEKTVRLSDHFGAKPVVLVFGNFTCGPFRSMYPAVDEIARRYQDQATFLAVYVREAHPTDGWAMKSNEIVGVSVAQPKNFSERCSVAGQCHKLLRPAIPLLVDEIDDRVGHAYSGMPARLYVIDRDGKVAYKGGRGPFGFKAREMEQALIMLLMDQAGESAAVN